MSFSFSSEGMKTKRKNTYRRNKFSSEPMSEINVTPMVDVMLVLLIIFMVAAPMLTVGIKVELPKTQAKALTDQKEPLIVTLKRNGAIFVQEKKTDERKLVLQLNAVTKNNPDVKIYIRADKNLNYGTVMRIIGTLSANEFKNFSFITDSEKTPLKKIQKNRRRK